VANAGKRCYVLGLEGVTNVTNRKRAKHKSGGQPAPPDGPAPAPSPSDGAADGDLDLDDALGSAGESSSGDDEVQVELNTEPIAMQAPYVPLINPYSGRIPGANMDSGLAPSPHAMDEIVTEPGSVDEIIDGGLDLGLDEDDLSDSLDEVTPFDSDDDSEMTDEEFEAGMRDADSLFHLSTDPDSLPVDDEGEEVTSLADLLVDPEAQVVESIQDRESDSEAEADLDLEFEEEPAIDLDMDAELDIEEDSGLELDEQPELDLSDAALDTDQLVAEADQYEEAGQLDEALSAMYQVLLSDAADPALDERYTELRARVIDSYFPGKGPDSIPSLAIERADLADVVKDPQLGAILGRMDGLTALGDLDIALPDVDPGTLYRLLSRAKGKGLIRLDD